MESPITEKLPFRKARVLSDGFNKARNNTFLHYLPTVIVLSHG